MNELLSNSVEISLDKLNYYQAANSDNETIKANFVIRLKEFEIVINSLTNKNEKDPLQHELILGRRGSGKSTLLKRIEIELIENKILNAKYIPINLAEEQVGIYRLFDLWEQVLTELQCKLKTDFQNKNFDEFSNSGDYTRYLFDQIHGLCLKFKKRIILLLDNFDRIVENFSDDGNLLREILINHNDVGIIAASTRMDEHFWKYDMPFYGFFRDHYLGPLSTKEIINLLYHWSKVLNIEKLREFADNNSGKIENIRILTDGSPRTLQFFVRYILNNDKLESYEYLKKLIDEVTPLYQERLNHLTPPLRKTIYEMAFIWEACSTGQLSGILKMESKLVSANLKYLTDKGITDKIATSGRNHLYRISERFFNLWIIITQGNPDQKRKAKWLSIFLENWYNSDQLKHITKVNITKLKSRSIDPKHALPYSKAVSQGKYNSLCEGDDIFDLTSKVHDSGGENILYDIPKKFEKKFSEINNLIENKEYKLAIEMLENIENEDDGTKFYGLGLIYSYLNKYKESEQYYLKAVENGNSEAMNNLVLLYYRENFNKVKALDYIASIEKSDFKIVIEIWNGIFDEVEKRSIDLIKEKPENDYSIFLQELMVHQQNTLVHNLFTNHEIGKQLQDKYQVLFYIEQILNNINKNEILLKIPPELKSTVDEVKQYIHSRESFYGYKQ